jgi:hypothetical protein
VRNDEPAGAFALTGSHFSPIANTTMSTMPETNSGTVDSDRPATLIVRSTALPRERAARTPPTMASGTTITKATAASLSECSSAGTRNVLTGARNWYEVPRLPCMAPDAQLQY